MSSPIPLHLAASLFVVGTGALLSPNSATGAEPKRVLVVTVTTGFRHSSIEAAEHTLLRLAHESKDFMIVEILRQPPVDVPQKPTPPKPLAADADPLAKNRFAQEETHFKELLSRWTPDLELQSKKSQEEFNRQITLVLAKLAPAALEENKIDGVIFANTSGDLPLPDKAGFIQWIEKGHAFIGIHSASDTLRSFPSYAEMLGASYAGHGAQTGLDLTAKDTTHPAVKDLSNPWRIHQEEFYHFKNCDSSKVHDLWSSNKNPSDKRPDQGRRTRFPVSWVRLHGAGKVFYTSLGHREDLWDASPAHPSRINWPTTANPPEVAITFQNHILGGIRWALGLVEGDAEPQVVE